MVCNSLDTHSLDVDQELYLIRYSHVGYPDFIMVKFKGYHDNRRLEYENDKGVKKKINLSKARYRLFVDENEMARILYDCFIKREVDFIDQYKDMFLKSQDVRPELWI